MGNVPPRKPPGGRGARLRGVLACARVGGPRACCRPGADLAALQEWIADTQDVAPWKKPPGGDQELPSEQPLEVRLARGDSELPAAPSTQEEDDDQEASPGSPESPRAPQAGELASLGSFTFVIADGAYMKL